MASLMACSGVTPRVSRPLDRASRGSPPRPSEVTDATLVHLATGKTEILGEGCSLNPAEEPAFYTATFHYDQNGILSGHYVYTMSSTYACGSGPDHYSMAGKIVDPALPAGLARWSAAPEWLRERLGSADVAGVSEIPPGLDRDGALAQFKAPVASSAK